MSDSPHTYRASWIFSMSGPPIRDGFLTRIGRRIVKVSQSHDGPYEDLEDCALLPGLVNCHTHLEFSNLTQPLGHCGIDFPDWLNLVVASRATVDLDEKRASIRAGVRESQQAGTIAIGEIGTTPWSSRSSIETAQPDHDPALIVFHEWIALDPARFEFLRQAGEDFLAETQRTPDARFGLSPHAPYTIHPDTFVNACELSRKQQWPIAMHLAETRDELELLETGKGPMAEFLAARGIDDHGAFSKSRSIRWYLEHLAQTSRALVVHGNYLGQSDLEFLGKHRDRLSLCFCPRTHDFFRHESYPLSAALRNGARVVLGTDSRASNPDLSMWNEFQFALKTYPTLSPARALEMITIAGAEAMGLPLNRAQIVAGSTTSVHCISLERNASDPFEALRSESAQTLSILTIK